MHIEHKITILAIFAVLTGVLATIAFNTYDASIRVKAYNDCTEANKVIAKMITSEAGESLRITSIPTCSMR